MKNRLFDPLSVPCTCEGLPESQCACGHAAGVGAGAEKVLRFVIAIDGRLTAEQREFCLSEIDRVEGHKRADHEKATDAELAHATLDAWTDYCRDKGLIA